MNDTYNFRNLLMEYKQISIPKIQRDYAQGRMTGKAPDVRENFLNDIFSGNVKSLDFIFGTAQELPSDNQKKFIPLDGQQRLSTLFLLYLYGVKTNKPNIDNQNLNLNRFTYETRKAARDFCNAIVNNDWTEILQDTIPSDVIVKQKWFMNYWLNDPTVEGMLTMLDAIHKKAIKTEDYPKLDDISFRFFDMNEHNLSDNLYIKMNSRGKPLTAFENLKASIDKILPKVESSSFRRLNDDNLKEKKTFDEQWKYCIDRQWTNMFWKYKENYLSDSPFIRFITNILSAHWISVDSIMANDDGEKNIFLRFLLSITGNEEYISFDKFQEVLPSRIEGDSDNEKRLATFVFLADNLNSFYRILKLDKLSEICRPSWEKDDYDLIKNVLQLKGDKYNPSNKERAMFYALVKCPYISIIETNISDAKVKIKHWMRVFWNIVEQEQERIRNFIGATFLINELSSKIADNDCVDIYDWLAEEENEIKSGFMKDQVNEECYKARQIKKNILKEDDIIFAESHPLLKGCISTLFEDNNCEKVSFGQTIQERIELLNELWQETNNEDYTFVKVLISFYDKDKPDGKILLKRSIENWKTLITDKLKDCFRKNKSNAINSDCEGWKSLLANTTVIDNSRDSGKIVGSYWDGKVILWATRGCNWNANENIILDNLHYKPWLANLVDKEKIICNQKVKDCEFFSGKNIWFRYEDSYFINYVDNNTVCLMKKDWKDKIHKNEKDNLDDPENSFYFYVEETMDENTFLEKLKETISAAKDEGSLC